MASEIIYVCKSKNNKNVREGELEILRKFENSLYFEFGESEMNIKKRFYDDLETLNNDFNSLMALKSGEVKKIVEEEPEVLVEEVIEKIEEKVEEEPEIEKSEEKKTENKRKTKKYDNKYNF